MAGRIVLERLPNGVVVLEIDNPAKFNAMSLSMWQTMLTHVRALSTEVSVKALAIRGAGDRAFVSGADISEFDALRSPTADTAAYDDAIDGTLAAIEDAPFPVIALIRGICMGGGMALAVACDLRYCEEDSKFRMPAARLGLGYGYQSMHQIVRVLGSAHASDIFYTARAFDGKEAERIGLVHKAFPSADMVSESDKLVAMVAENAPMTVRLAKKAIRLAGSKMEPAHADLIAAGRRSCVESEDYAEGRRAFAEKRAPRFKGC